MKSSDFTLAKITAARIGTSQRVSANNSPCHFPGPAHYKVDDLNNTRQHSPRPFIGTSTRLSPNRTINWPGPATYNTFRDISTATPHYQKITITCRNSSNSSSESPGPVYNTIDAGKWVRTRNPAFKIGTAPKLASTLKRDSHKLPGPGSYSFVESQHRLQMRFPKSNRAEFVKNKGSPGPGHYMLPAKFNDVQAYQIPKHLRITQV